MRGHNGSAGQGSLGRDARSGHNASGRRQRSPKSAGERTHPPSPRSRSVGRLCMPSDPAPCPSAPSPATLSRPAHTSTPNDPSCLRPHTPLALLPRVLVLRDMSNQSVPVQNTIFVPHPPRPAASPGRATECLWVYRIRAPPRSPQSPREAGPRIQHTRAELPSPTSLVPPGARWQKQGRSVDAQAPAPIFRPSCACEVVPLALEASTVDEHEEPSRRSHRDRVCV
ncbi:hypothetical protein C8Q78DRAFT_488143 [Trametes maxima]|nr:hypothetical protein C8Q78DRAFT_488143 [Trametes maxima]